MGPQALNYRVRRATLEDLKPLAALWQSMTFQVDDLTRRITEFQVAEGEGGNLVGAIGLEIFQKQGLIHSEGFTDFAVADYIRPLFWERIQSLATNHGLMRLWTREQAPFWNHCGLVPATAQDLEHLPAPWRGLVGDWLTLKLREGLDAIISADAQFKLFMDAEKAKTQRALQHGRILRGIAILIALAVAAAAIVAVFYLLRKNPHLLPH